LSTEKVVSSKILIVDDEPVIGKMVQDILETYGLQTVYASNQMNALECMRNFKPTVALVDYRLVETTGFEVSQQLKKIDEDLPVILMTAYPSLELAIQAIQQGMYDFLAKPIDQAYLYRSITKAIEKRALTEENKKLIVSLRDKNEALDRLNRMKSKFLSIVTHDLKTPLSSIQGYNEILNMTEDLSPDQKTKCIDAIRRSSERMNNLINNLLDMVSIESGRLRIEKQKLDFLNLCREIQATFTPVAKTKNARLTWDLPENTLMVNGDANRLNQVLTNLISNAFKHIPEGGKVSVNVSKRQETLLIEVMDDGEGIAPENQKRIFEQFYQVESSETRRQGLGLGLSIAQEIIHSHQGEIWVESAGLGSGSKFYFTLPLLES